MSLAGRVFSDAFDFTSVMALFVVVYSGTTKVTESVDDDALPGTFAKLGAAGQSLVLATVIATVAVDEGDMFKKQAAKLLLPASMRSDVPPGTMSAMPWPGKPMLIMLIVAIGVVLGVYSQKLYESEIEAYIQKKRKDGTWSLTDNIIYNKGSISRSRYLTRAI